MTAHQQYRNYLFFDDHAGGINRTDELVSFIHTPSGVKTFSEHDTIKDCFPKNEWQVFAAGMNFVLLQLNYEIANHLLTGSGNFGGADMLTFAEPVTGSNN